MSLVITGASGQLATGVIEYALESVEPSDLILVTRTPEKLAGHAEQGASVRHGDFDEPATLAAALSGGERMLLVSTDVIGNRIDQHGRAIDAAVEAGVGLIAYTSIINPVEDNPAAVVPEHMATEEKIRQSGADWVFLRNSIYADLQPGDMAAATESGVLVTNQGAGRVSYITRDDCAAAAAAVLVGESAGKAYDITGPEAVGVDERAEIFSAVAGVEVEVVQVDDEAYAAGMADATGMPLEATRLFASFGQAAREGHLDVVGPDFEDLVGRKPESLRSFLEKLG